MKRTKKTIVIRLIVAVFLIGTAAVMAIIGRGHTVYIDNKTIEYDGRTYEAYYRATVSTEGEQGTRLGKRERAGITCIGQQFTMIVGLMSQEDGEEVTQLINIALPYGMDGIIINLPAFMAGLPQEAWMSQFISEAPVEEDESMSQDTDLSEFDMQ